MSPVSTKSEQPPQRAAAAAATAADAQSELQGCPVSGPGVGVDVVYLHCDGAGTTTRVVGAAQVRS